MGTVEVGTIEVGDAEANALRRKAIASGRSIQELVADLVVATDALERNDWIRRADAIDAMTPKGVMQTDGIVLVREDRDG